MALINFFDDIFGEVSKTETYEAGVELKKIINKYIEEKDSISVACEVYDFETGETSYIIPEVKEYKTVCLVNGEEQELSYLTKEDDIVNFILVPMSKQQWFNYGLGALEIIGGAALTIFTKGLGAQIGAGLIVSGVASIIGQAASDIYDYYNSDDSSSSSKSDSLKEAEDVYGLSGGSNQSIIDHRFPIILGKHLVNPYVVGSYYNETYTTDEGGNDGGQYLNQLYCVGYGPLKLTDFKIGDVILAYNRTYNDNIHKTVMHGLLNGYNGNNTADILNKWKNNDVKLEILQAGDWNKTGDSKWGTIYPQTVEQIEPNANILNLKDKEISDTASENLTYLGTSIPNGFKSNTVRFSHACPQKLEVELDFPNGLYAYRTYTKNGAQIKYYNLPICFVIQWRYVKNNQESSDADSPEGWNNFDYIKIGAAESEDYTKITPSNYSINEKLFEYRSSFGRKDYLTLDNDDSVKSFFMKDSFINTDIFKLQSLYSDKVIPENLNNYAKVSIQCVVNVLVQKSTWVKRVYKSTNPVIVQFKDGVDASLYKKGTVVTSDIFTTVPQLKIKSGLYKENGYDKPTKLSSYVVSESSYGGTWNSPSAIYVPSWNVFYDWVGCSSLTIEETYSDSNLDWYKSFVSTDSTGNITTKSELPKDDINVNERRYVAVKEFTTEECAKMINYDDSGDSSIDSVEVRVLRLTPCYLEEYEWGDTDKQKSSDFTTAHCFETNYSGMKYNDLCKWASLRSFCFDKDKFKEGLDNVVLSLGQADGYEKIKDIPSDKLADYKSLAVSGIKVTDYPQRPITEEDLNKFCYVALRLKQDAAETGGSSLNKLSVIAQNFVPVYNQTDKVWSPNFITESTRYYHKYLNEDKDEYIIDDCTELEYKNSKLGYKTVSLFEDTVGNIGTKVIKANYGYYLSSTGTEFSALTDLANLLVKINSDEPIELSLNYDSIKAGSSVKIADGLTIKYQEGLSYSGICLINTNDNISVNFFKKDDSIKSSEYFKASKGNDFTTQIKNQIFNSTTEVTILSNGIDLADRPEIPGSDMIAAGWTDVEEDSTCTVYSSSYTNEDDTGDYPTIGIAVTPILQDGTILSPTELDTYAGKILAGGDDTKGILLYKFERPDYFSTTEVSKLSGLGYLYNQNYSVYKVLDYYCQILHEIHEIYYLGTDEEKQSLYSLLGKSLTTISSADIKSYCYENDIEYPVISKFSLMYSYRNFMIESFNKAFIEVMSQMGLISSSYVTSRHELSEEIDELYCSQNVASQALYSLVGPHVGIDAKTYDCVNLDSFTKLYNFCEDVTDGTVLGSGEEDTYGDGLKHMKFTCNGVISSEVKLESLLEKILLCGRSYLKRDEQNRYEVLLGQPVDYPSGVINQKNIISKSNSRSYEDEISGYLVSFVDETDNFTTNNIYIMADGEDYKNPTHEVSSLSLQYVTNREQIYSLARFNLMAKLYQKESYTRTVGRMGYNISLGDVFLMQDDSLLVGKEHGARITSLITSEDGNYLYGIMIDDPINFSGEENFGCTIVQPGKYNASRCVTLQLCTADGLVVSETETLTPEIGLTNKLYFANKISLTEATEDDETADFVQVLPKVGNLVAFGTLTAITEKVQVMGIKPKEKDQFELTLVPYNPDLYNMGTVMPTFTSNMTLPSSAEMNVDFENSTYKYNSETAAQESSSNLITAEETTVPNLLTNIKAVAYEDKIELSCDNDLAQGKYDSTYYCTWCITKADGTSKTFTSAGLTANYEFSRSLDGYPEKNDLENWSISVKNTNQYGVSSDYTEEYDIDVSNYTKTWNPELPVVTMTAIEDGININVKENLSTTYGSNTYTFTMYKNNTEIGTVTKIGTTENKVSYEYVFDRDIDGYPEISDLANYSLKCLVINESGNKKEGNFTSINTDSYKSWILGIPTVTAVAGRDSIEITIDDLINNNKYGTKTYTTKLIKNGSAIDVNKIDTYNYEYKFNRTNNEYPEASDLTAYSVKIIVASESNSKTVTKGIDTTNYGTWLIPSIKDLSAVADENGISIKGDFSISSSQEWYSSPFNIVYEVCKNTTAETKEYTDIGSNRYMFIRTDDIESSEYLEASDLKKWQIRAHWSSSMDETFGKTGAYKISSIDTTSYGTWKTVIPTVTEKTVDRTITLTMVSSTSVNIYGNVSYDIQVARNPDDVDSSTSEITWYKPDVISDPYASESNYKIADSVGLYASSGNIFIQTMPLLGQDSNNLTNTVYYFRVRSRNEYSVSDWSELVIANALCTNIQDIVKANLTTKAEYVESLSAIAANIGVVKQGAISSTYTINGEEKADRNYWALSNCKDDLGNEWVQGEFRVGNDDEYLKVEAVRDSDGNLVLDDNAQPKLSIKLKISGFSVTSTGSASKTEIADIFAERSTAKTLVVYDDSDGNRRLILKASGIVCQELDRSISTVDVDDLPTLWDNNSDDITTKGRFEIDVMGNVFITNCDEDDTTLPKIAVAINDEDAKIYHFDSNKLDQNGENGASIVTDGVITSTYGSAFGDASFNGTLTKTLEDNSDFLFYSRSNLIRIGDTYINNDGTVKDTLASIFNNKASTSWGLTTEQVAARIAKIKED